MFLISNTIKFIDPRRLDFRKFYKYLDIRNYDFYKINKKINTTKYKYIAIYFVAFLIFVGFIYLVIPKFYIYDKSKIAKIICFNKEVQCLIRGKVNYSFYPTPRIKIKDLLINHIFESRNPLITIETAEIKLYIKKFWF